MQKLICMFENNLTELNTLLNSGWEIVDIKTFCQPVAEGGHGYNREGTYGCYVLLEKDKVK